MGLEEVVPGPLEVEELLSSKAKNARGQGILVVFSMGVAVCVLSVVGTLVLAQHSPVLEMSNLHM